MRIPLLLPLLLVALACPGDRKDSERTPVDTVAPADTAIDLSQIQPDLPPAEPDTFTPRRPRPPRTRTSTSGGSIPPAPDALMEAVAREQAFSRFCYEEFGQKSDPSLVGNVAMVVTVGSGGITNATVGDAKWSSDAGRAVNRCLNERARQAWKLGAGEVRPGQYVVPLSFRGS